MTTRIGTIEVAIVGNNAGLQRAIATAERALGATGGRFDRLSKRIEHTTAQWTQGAFSRLIIGGGIAIGFKKAFDAVDQFDAATRRLSATAKITGTSLGFLEGVASGAKDEFKLSTRLANDLTVELGKLTAKAGDLSKSSDALRAFLDLGAARGLDAEETLQAVRQAILGIDEGTDKLFNANPSVLYKRYADAIGVSVGALDDQQKAQAIVNAALEDGGKVTGQYADFLESAAGKSATLAVRTEEAAVAFGKAVEPLRLLGLTMSTWFAQKIRDFIGGIQLMAVDVQIAFMGIPQIVKKALGLTLQKFGQFFIDLNSKLPSWMQRAMGVDRENEILQRLVDAGQRMIDQAEREVLPLLEARNQMYQQILGEMGVETGGPRVTAPSAGGGGGGGRSGLNAPMAGVDAAVVKLADSVKRFSGFGSEAVAVLGGMEEKGERLAQVGQNIAAAFADSLVDALRSGRDAFRSFVDYAITQLLRLAAQFAVFSALQAAFPGSGFVSAFGRSLGFAATQAATPNANAVSDVGAVTSGASLNLSGMPPAGNPLAQARDAQWMRFLTESLTNAEAGGYAFGGSHG